MQSSTGLSPSVPPKKEKARVRSDICVLFGTGVRIDTVKQLIFPLLSELRNIRLRGGDVINKFCLSFFSSPSLQPSLTVPRCRPRRGEVQAKGTRI